MAWSHIHKGVSFLENNRLDPITGCWNWTGCRNNNGYGKMRYLDKNEYVHRLSAHFYLKYALRSELKVLHRCDNPACFNPKHLFIGTHADNMRDCVAKGRHRSSAPWTHCKLGHLMTLMPNAKPLYGNNPRHVCKTCQKQRNAKRYLKISIVR